MTIYSGRLPVEALGAPHGPGPKRRGVFIAYRFNHQSSVAFRDEIRSDIHRASSGIDTHDGQVGPNADWAETIRDRLKRCSVLVADVQGYSKEIMFEFGFAAQLGLALMSVRVEGTGGPLPRWLTRLQYFHWPKDRYDIVDDACRLASSQRRGNVFSSGRAVAVKGLALDLPPTLRETVEAQCSSMDLVDLRLSADGEEPSMGRQAYKLATQSGLIVAALNGTRSDSYIHFVAGATAAQPHLWGSSGRKRRLLLIVPEGADRTDFVADALLRVDGLVETVSSPADVVRSINDWRRNNA